MSQLFRQLTKEETKKYLEVCSNVLEKEIKEIQILKKAGRDVAPFVSRIRDINKVLMSDIDEAQRKSVVEKRNECINEIDLLQKALDIELSGFLPLNAEGYAGFNEYHQVLKSINNEIIRREDSIGLLELFQESLINRLNQDKGFNSQDFSNNKTC